MNSPYSYLGIGKIKDDGNVVSQSLSGLSAGVRDKRELNFLNPASITSLNVTTYEAGIGASFLNVTEGDANNKSALGALDYVSLAFPMAKVGGATGFGIRRYSNVGYAIEEEFTADGLGTLKNTFTGEGGINKFNLTQAFTVKGVSLGANLNYLFGTIKHDGKLDYEDPSITQSPTYLKSNYIKDFNFDFGFQYSHEFKLDSIDRNKVFEIIVGGTYVPGYKLKTENLDTREVSLNIFNEDTLVIGSGNITMPTQFSVGICAVLNRKLKVGFDYRSAAWSDFRNPLFDESGAYQLANSTKMIIGLQYTPNKKMTKGLFTRTTYKFGVSSGKSEIVNSGTQLTNSGISFGLAIPLRNYSNVINLGYRYSELSSGKNKDLMNESTHRVILSFTFNEKWFTKYKYD
ncbi:MAG: hypothetical protein HRT72_02915 [Flavobacteriales bacterium]|nr:hypothetical protein [Flavobacteriales bacterium]